MKRLDAAFAEKLLQERGQLLDLVRGLHITQLDGEIRHTQVVPHATYSPWRSDTAFITAYDAVKSHTLVDIYRCYELWDLVRQQASLAGALVEVGVWRGGTAAIMALAQRKVGDDAHLYLFDTFSGCVKPNREKDTNYQGGEHADCSQQGVDVLLSQLGISAVTVAPGVFPDTTGGVLADEPIKLCHIDVDTHDSARDIFFSIWPQVVPGGVVVFDDYGFWGCEGVTKLVNSISLPDMLLLHNLNGHALLVKRPA